MNLSLRTEYTEDEIVLFVGGEVDAFAASQLKDKLLPLIQGATGKTISLDVAEVAYMDSTGVGVIIGALKACKSTGNRLMLKNVPPRIERLFKITGLAEVISVEPIKGERA